VRAQASIEALIALAAYCALLGLLLSSALAAFRGMENSAIALRSGAEAQKCSLVLNAMHSNSGAVAENISAECAPGEVKSIAETGIVLREGKTFLVVENEPHYSNE